MSFSQSSSFSNVQGVNLPQNYLAQPNNLESALESLDLKGLLVLNGLITQQALKLILAAEGVMSPFKQPTEAPMAMSIANKAAYTAAKKLPKKKK